MKIIVVSLFVVIMCGMFIFSNFKREKFYTALIIIPGISIIVYQTTLFDSLSSTQNTILGLINVIAVFVISFSFFRDTNTNTQT